MDLEQQLSDEQKKSRAAFYAELSGRDEMEYPPNQPEERKGEEH